MGGINQQDASSSSGTQIVSHASLPKGTRLQEFKVVEVIGEGGFGIVYLAHDMQLNRFVAIKEYMPASLASRGDGVSVVVRSEQNMKTFQAGLESFITEARLLAQFKHPALVDVFRFWEQNGTAYMAMSYYQGITLRQVLHDSETNIDERWLKAMFAPLLDALELMHGQNVFHRDIAPDNILVLSNGAAVLLDLGAARRIIGDLTQAVTVVLKPGYAPIEQYSDDVSIGQGAWTDIYAIGAVLHFAVTGKAPIASVARIMRDNLKPLAGGPYQYFSPQFLAGIDKALAIKPEDRPQSISELREVLGIPSYLHTIASAPPKPSDLLDSDYSNPVTETHSGMNEKVDADQKVVSLALEDNEVTMVLKAPYLVEERVASELADDWEGQSEADAPGDDAGQLNGDNPPPTAKGRQILRGVAGWRGVIAISVVFCLAVIAILTSVNLMSPNPLPGMTSANRLDKTENQSLSSRVPTNTQSVSVPNEDIADASGALTPAYVERPVLQAKSSDDSVNEPDRGTALPTNDEKEHVDVVSAAVAPDPLKHHTVARQLKARSGRLLFLVQPWGEVWVDGVQRGVSPPLKALAVSEGVHKIELRNAGFPSTVMDVQVVKGNAVTIEHNFNTKSGEGSDVGTEKRAGA